MSDNDNHAIDCTWNFCDIANIPETRADGKLYGTIPNRDYFEPFSLARYVDVFHT